MRDLLADAPEDDYRAAVETLAAHRRTGPQRVLVSYLVPTETTWMDECCARAQHESALRVMLFCSVGSPEQLAALTARVTFGYGEWSRRVLATLIEAVGVDPVVELMAGAFDTAYAEERKVGAEVLSRLPADRAFGLLLDHRGEKQVAPALYDAMKRYPVRAVRLLAPAAVGSSKDAAAVRDLLAGHVADHPEAAAAALPGLPAEARATVERLAAETAGRAERVPTAPAEALPPLLAAPPWTRRRKPAKPIVITDLTPPDDSSIVWPDGRRDEWLRSATTYADYLVNSDWPQMIRRYRARELRFLEEEVLFTLGPVDALRPYVADWLPPQRYGAEQWMRPIIARFELDALRPALAVAVDESPSVAGGLLLPFLDVRVARLMADWLDRLARLARPEHRALPGARRRRPGGPGPHRRGGGAAPPRVRPRRGRRGHGGEGLRRRGGGGRRGDARRRPAGQRPGPAAQGRRLAAPGAAAAGAAARPRAGAAARGSRAHRHDAHDLQARCAVRRVGDRPGDVRSGVPGRVRLGGVPAVAARGDAGQGRLGADRAGPPRRRRDRTPAHADHPGLAG
jgi:hypothetical protein